MLNHPHANGPGPADAPRVSIGVIARNEEEVIESSLDSIFEQTLFGELARLGLQCEILCLANGCSDRTVPLARACFARHQAGHRHRQAFTAKVLELAAPGKLPTWNYFVHEASSPGAEMLIQMDGDVVLHHPETFWSLVQALWRHPEAAVAVDEPVKDLVFRPRKRLRDRFSIGSSQITAAGGAQLTGQLYCIRAPVARNIYLPRDLAACEDGFIKWLVCTDFLTGPSRADRIVQAENASHIFEAYTTWAGVLKNQKRQMIGQTMIHLLIDHLLPALPTEQKQQLGATLRQWDQEDPAWLARTVRAHMQGRPFWRLFPGIPGFVFRRWRRTPGVRRWILLPPAAARFLLMMISCWRAARHLRSGQLAYWPATRSPGLKRLKQSLQQPVET